MPIVKSGGLTTLHSSILTCACDRAGKREQWRWEAHEAVDLGRRLDQSKVDNKPVFLWAFDDICLAHTKRRVLSLSGGFANVADITVTTTPEHSGETEAGLKQVLRQVLTGHTKGLKLASVAAAYKDRTNTALDDDVATLLGYKDLNDMLGSMPDAVRVSGDRLVGTRPATRHEVQAWIITAGGREVEGSTYIIDEEGQITAQRVVDRSAQKIKPSTAPLLAHLPYDESVVYEDLTEMRKIHLASLIYNVEHRLCASHSIAIASRQALTPPPPRFLSEKVYSYIGNMLLAVNPYRHLTMPVPGERSPCSYYDTPVRAYYARLRGETRQQGVRAHIFVVADLAYRALASEGKNQSVVISGESGAGKTKSAREILRCRPSTLDSITISPYLRGGVGGSLRVLWGLVSCRIKE